MDKKLVFDVSSAQRCNNQPCLCVTIVHSDRNGMGSKISSWYNNLFIATEQVLEKANKFNEEFGHCMGGCKLKIVQVNETL